MKNLSIEEFLNITASSEPVPGGGTVSALCGALASALCRMVAGLTVGRKKYADAEPRMKEIIDAMTSTQELFTTLMQDDSDAYSLVMKAFKMPKDTDEQRAERAEAIEDATKLAAATPLKVAETAVLCMKPIRDVADRGNQNAITDACVAMMLARTCALGAILNVRINLAGLNDRAWADEKAARCLQLEEAAITAEQSLLAAVNL